jgi:glutamate/tyrosine decarboxylase-like PLP-dependent enzyme
MAAIAAAHGAGCHVDACIGAFVLPFLERMGVDVPPWDFRVPGVTSISADIHKYGYTFKGASVVLHRDRSLLRHQHFWYEEWPGGLYASATTAGTRPAPPLAAAWFAIRHLGADGYLRLADEVRTATRRFRQGIDAIEGLRVTHEPDMSVMEFTADDRDVVAIAAGMESKGWRLDRQQGGMHLMVSPYHLRVVDDFLTDLAAVVAAAPPGTGEMGPLPTYGGIA